MAWSDPPWFRAKLHLLPIMATVQYFPFYAAQTPEEGTSATRETTPVAEATDRSVGQQRAHSWALDLGPAATSGTMAWGLVRYDQPHAALNKAASTRL